MTEQFLPNLERGLPGLLTGLNQTLNMILISGTITFIVGITFGVTLVITQKGGLLENFLVFNFLDKGINVIRSIPFLILMILLIPVSRMLVGTGIGVRGAIVPLSVGAIPFFSRQIETAIAEVDKGLIEASLAMGFSPLAIIFKVYLRESIPSITRVTMITAINLISFTTMAGAIGAGGLGDFAIRYGHQLGFTDMLWLTIAVILALVSIIQLTGNTIIKLTKR